MKNLSLFDDSMKVAVVTGATGSGMGRSIALTLAKQGYAVVLNYLHDHARAVALETRLAARNAVTMLVQANVFEADGAADLIRSTLNRFGRIDVLVIGPGADWNAEKVIDLKPTACLKDVQQEIAPIYHLVPPVLTVMKSRHAGRIIGIASNMDIPSPAYSYNVAKSARIDALMRSVPEAWNAGVTVNVIAPGPVDPFASSEAAFDACDHRGTWMERSRITPQDIAEGVAFLCGDDARYITGCILPYQF